ncbi:hypothetical protein CHS0354_038032 [Potamilus streckersoni]|uniref:C2H2-type domain-containing protein n=1 Tax=Potamilus streckersoni TaxID=2493646 RepID=A0AAE0SS47_9BIVA|nr:hypothetical protein CHS0354_038032 [Potamilus streckersoni]
MYLTKMEPHAHLSRSSQRQASKRPDPEEMIDRLKKLFRKQMRDLITELEILGDQTIVLVTNVYDNTFDHFGSSTGEKFLSTEFGGRGLEYKFRGYCMDHHVCYTCDITFHTHKDAIEHENKHHKDMYLGVPRNILHPSGIGYQQERKAPTLEDNDNSSFIETGSHMDTDSQDLSEMQSHAETETNTINMVERLSTPDPREFSPYINRKSTPSDIVDLHISSTAENLGQGNNGTKMGNQSDSRDGSTVDVTSLSYSPVNRVKDMSSTETYDEQEDSTDSIEYKGIMYRCTNSYSLSGSSDRNRNLSPSGKQIKSGFKLPHVEQVHTTNELVMKQCRDGYTVEQNNKNVIHKEKLLDLPEMSKDEDSPQVYTGYYHENDTTDVLQYKDDQSKQEIMNQASLQLSGKQKHKANLRPSSPVQDPVQSVIKTEPEDSPSTSLSHVTTSMSHATSLSQLEHMIHSAGNLSMLDLRNLGGDLHTSLSSLQTGFDEHGFVSNLENPGENIHTGLRSLYHIPGQVSSSLSIPCLLQPTSTDGSGMSHSSAKSNSLPKHRNLKSSTFVDKYLSPRQGGSAHYQCEFCGKSFVMRSLYKFHKKTHMEVRPYVCELCKKPFKDKETLKRHSRIHSGEKPYMCNICGQSFNHTGTLSNHRRRHKLRDGKPTSSFLQ